MDTLNRLASLSQRLKCPPDRKAVSSKTECADGHRQFVRQMRLCLLGAMGCSDQSLDHLWSVRLIQ